jgi:hypothetical protein
MVRGNAREVRREQRLKEEQKKVKAGDEVRGDTKLNVWKERNADIMRQKQKAADERREKENLQVSKK